MFYLIVLVACEELQSCWHSGGKPQPTDVCKGNMLKSSYRKIWNNILTARWKSKRMERQNGQKKRTKYTDDPSVDLIRVKNMLNNTISELPDVVVHV